MDQAQLEQLMEQIRQQEEALVFDHFSQADAWKLGQVLYEHCCKAPKPMSMAIYLNGTEVFKYIMEGATANNDVWMRRKKNTVQLMQMSSLRKMYESQYKGWTQEQYGYPVGEYGFVGGGFPLRLRGSGVVGAICVSGLPGEEDHKLLVRAIEDYLSRCENKK